jgi:hypothetical protein
MLVVYLLELCVFIALGVLVMYFMASLSIPCIVDCLVRCFP